MNRCQTQVSGVRSQKAVGVIASANKMTLKSATTALGVLKLKNSKSKFIRFNICPN